VTSTGVSGLALTGASRIINARPAATKPMMAAETNAEE
jgi:hypothetical protein